MIAQQQQEFRHELDRLPSWQQRVARIDAKLKETSIALGARDKKLLGLRRDFDSLTLDFWRARGSTLGCEDPQRTITDTQTRMRSIGYRGTILLVAGLVIVLGVFCLLNGNVPASVVGWGGVAGLGGIAVLIVRPLSEISHARKVAAVLAHEQNPFWLTGGSIALSNLGTVPPAEAKWWWTGRIAIVFVRHLTVRCSIDAFTGEPIWTDQTLSGDDNRLSAQVAAQILKDLLSRPWHQQMIKAFDALACLETDAGFLKKLQVEAIQECAEELRTTELRIAQQKAAEASTTRPDDQPGVGSQSTQREAQNGWDSLIIPQTLRETLQAYCRILRDYQGYRDAGVHLPKGLLFYGPPGCGKTKIAKTLSAEAGLNFVALSTSDCKQMWIGWSADRLAKVFTEARAKQPSLIFIDEIDAVCPPRGAYHDSMSQEFTAQLLQEIDGLLSDTQAIFLVGATNRSDQVDAAILSRFSERIEIPLPDATTRAALLELFLRPLRFSGDKTRVIRQLALDTADKSGRDLRAVVNQAVLAAVKRSSSPKNFALAVSDFALCPSS